MTEPITAEGFDVTVSNDITSVDVGPIASSDTATKRTLWKAGELAKRTGLTRQSLHQYVLLGLLVPVETTKGGQRLFGEDSADRVRLIRGLLGNGYTLAAVRDIFFQHRPSN